LKEPQLEVTPERRFETGRERELSDVFDPDTIGSRAIYPIRRAYLIGNYRTTSQMRSSVIQKYYRLTKRSPNRDILFSIRFGSSKPDTT
jgi:hypothetical protein